MMFVLIPMLSASPVTRAEMSPPGEYELKAAFLFNFAKFVYWPPDAFLDTSAPITLCIWGEDPFGTPLDKLIGGKKVSNRTLAIHRTKQLEDLRACHIVFISTMEDRRLPEILRKLKGASTLVVGESPEFAERGGEIQFYMEDNRVRFTVNVDAVQRARHTISAQLLALAKIVHDDNRSRGD